MSGGPQPWDRQPGETVPAFAAFVEYRDMGPGRSGEAVGARLGKSVSLVERWRGRWSWVARVAAWDAHLDAANQAHQVDLRRILAEELVGGDGQHFREAARSLRAVATAGDVGGLREYLNRTLGPVPKEITIATRQDLEAILAVIVGVVLRETGDDGLTQRVAVGAADELERRGAGR